MKSDRILDLTDLFKPRKQYKHGFEFFAQNREKQ
jgi:hypothetical protein